MSSKNPERVTISTWLDSDDAALVRARAHAADRTVAAEVRVALRGYFDRLPDDAAAEYQQGEVSLTSAA